MRNQLFFQPIVIIILLMLWFTIGLAFAKTEPQKLFDRGNESYLKGDFQHAIEDYQSIISSKHESDSIYYNLGLAFIKTSQNAKAVWAFEKALHINPFNINAEENLKNVRKEIAGSIEHQPISTLQKYISSVSQSSTYFIFLFSEALFFLVLMIVIVFRKFHVLTLRVALLTVFAIALCFGTWYFSQRYISSQEMYIVMNPASLKEGPVISSSNLFEIPAGTKIKAIVQEQHSDQNDTFLYAKLPNGLLGWIEKKDLLSLSENL